jgi:acyl carrier protein
MFDITNEVTQAIGARMRTGDRTVLLSDRLDSLDLESLDVLEISFDLEERFNIEIPFNANTKFEFDTVGALVQVIERLVAKKAAAE